MARNGAPEPVGGMTDARTWSKSVWVPQIPDSFLVDEDGLSKELAIEKRAIDCGGKGLPKATDKRLDETQMKICERIFEGILMLNQFLAQQLGATVAAARDNRVRVPSADGLDEEVQLKLESAISDHRPELALLRQAQISRGQELRAFMRRHKRTQPARYTNSHELTCAIIFAMIVGESLLNGALLQAVMANGLVGGALLAGVISMLNVGLGLAAGLWGWRNLSHMSPLSRSLGWTLTILLAVFGIAFNLGVAHFREGAEILVDNPDYQYGLSELTKAARAHWEANGPFGLASLPAWALLLLGLGIHFFAAKKGWEDLADRYPDYMQVDKVSKAADLAYNDHLEGMRDIARAAVERLESTAEITAHQAQEWLDEIETLIDQAQQRCEEVKDSEDIWVSTGNRFLKLYRDVNTEIQGNDQIPAYFATYPTSEDYRTRSFDGVRPSGEVQKRVQMVKRAMDDLTSLKTDGETTLTAAKEAVRTIHRNVNGAIRSLDAALSDAEKKADATARERLREQERSDSAPVNEPLEGADAATA